MSASSFARELIQPVNGDGPQARVIWSDEMISNEYAEYGKQLAEGGSFADELDALQATSYDEIIAELGDVLADHDHAPMARMRDRFEQLFAMLGSYLWETQQKRKGVK